MNKFCVTYICRPWFIPRIFSNTRFLYLSVHLHKEVYIITYMTSCAGMTTLGKQVGQDASDFKIGLIT